MSSLGNDFILPTMLPERRTDIARKDNIFKNHAIQVEAIKRSGLLLHTWTAGWTGSRSRRQRC